MSVCLSLVAGPSIAALAVVLHARARSASGPVGAFLGVYMPPFAVFPGVAARSPRAGDLPHMPSIPLPSSFTPFTPFTPGVRKYPICPLALDIPHIPFCSGYTPYTPYTPYTAYTPLAPIYRDLPRSAGSSQRYLQPQQLR